MVVCFVLQVTVLWFPWTSARSPEECNDKHHATILSTPFTTPTLIKGFNDKVIRFYDSEDMFYSLLRQVPLYSVLSYTNHKTLLVTSGMSQWGLSYSKINEFQYVSYKCQQITEPNFYKNVYYFKNIQCKIHSHENNFLSLDCFLFFF